jgi:hypothetical protein
MGLWLPCVAALWPPTRVEEAGAAAPGSGGSRGSGIEKRCGDLAPRGWSRRFFLFSLFFLFVSERNFVQAAYHLYKLCTGFPLLIHGKPIFAGSFKKKVVLANIVLYGRVYSVSFK